TELETMNRDKNSALVQNLKSLNRSRYSYTEFLRRFGMRGEVMRLSEDEFDQNYYSYSMELYGNIPLIEPLEYSEQKRIREFVIAIDTSGSVKGDVVQSFIQHTHDILQRQENFFTRVNMHIIQCDDRIREDVCIHSKEEFDQYLKTMEILGLGKTDFRPVFEYVDELIRTKELSNLQGLIYFTDGKGTFPEKKPTYDSAFILHNDGYAEAEVPSWAMHLTLSEEDILDKRFSAY
ncbi:MAG: metallopeptidase, partial [Oscillospiraceae bacterium]|nr:metallopeptidase [Oscillospiraceae bacterium]